MNILALHTISPALCARKKQEPLPEKLPLTGIEIEFNEILLKLHRVENDIRTQKQNLIDMYSAQDRFDYRELLKKRQNLLGKLKRIAKKEAKEYYEIEIDIDIKKQYNRFAPKIMRAKNAGELQQIIDLMSSYLLYVKAKEMLFQLIKKKGF